jgi:hypothetical protein
VNRMPVDTNKKTFFIFVSSRSVEVFLSLKFFQ